MEQPQQQQQQQPMTSMNYPHPSAQQPQQQGGPSNVQQMPNGMMRPPPMAGTSMNGFVPQNMGGGGGNPMGMGMPGGMGNAMSPGMNHPGMLQQQQARQVRSFLFRMSLYWLLIGRRIIYSSKKLIIDRQCIMSI
jgi:hypothetical protein